MLTSAAKNTKIKTSCSTAINRRILETTKKRYPLSKGKKLTVRVSRGHNQDKIKSYYHQVGDLQTENNNSKEVSPLVAIKPCHQIPVPKTSTVTEVLESGLKVSRI